MPPRDTYGRSDKGPTRSTRTSKQIKVASKAKIAAARSRSRASERRKKAAKQAAAKAAAIAKIKAAEKAAANKKTAVAPGTGRTTGGRGRTVEKPGARAAAAARPAQAARMMAVNNPRSAPRTPPEMSPRPIAVQQAAARQAAAAAARRDANRPSVIAAQRAAQMGRVRPQPKPTGMSISRAKAGLYNLLPEFLRTDNKSGRTAKQQAFHDSIHGADARRKRRRRRKDSGRDDVVTTETTTTPTTTTELPPEVMPPVMPPQFPQYPGYGGGMMGGLGAFGYNPALMAFESQQGAGQVPYYMAAARNAMTPNMSPAFMHAARNYDILGGMQRTAPRPMEMMSAAERAEIANINSNFNVPNYNSPYDQFDFFRNLVGGRGSGRPLMDMFPEGPPARFGGPGKGASRPMSQEQAMAMRSGIMGML